MGKSTPTLDTIAMNHTDRKYNKVSAIFLNPDAGRMIRVNPGSLKEGLFEGYVTCNVTIRADDIETLYLTPKDRLS